MKPKRLRRNTPSILESMFVHRFRRLQETSIAEIMQRTGCSTTEAENVLADMLGASSESLC